MGAGLVLLVDAYAARLVGLQAGVVLGIHDALFIDGGEFLEEMLQEVVGHAGRLQVLLEGLAEGIALLFAHRGIHLEVRLIVSAQAVALALQQGLRLIYREAVLRDDGALVPWFAQTVLISGVTLARHAQHQQGDGCQDEGEAEENVPPREVVNVVESYHVLSVSLCFARYVAG